MISSGLLGKVQYIYSNRLNLGKIRKDLDSEILSEYQNLFENYFLKSYSITITLNDGCPTPTPPKPLPIYSNS